MDARSLIVALTIVLAACAGPEPSVQNATAAPSPRPGATRVSLDVVNKGGHGTVELKFALRGGGHVIRAERTLAIEKDETVHFETDIETPPGTYSVTADVEYPD